MMHEARDWAEPSFVFLTLHRKPARGEEIVLELQGKEIPRSDYNVLENRDTGDLHVFKRDATWGDCCQARVSFRKAVA